MRRDAVDELMAELIANRAFQRLWLDTALEALEPSNEVNHGHVPSGRTSMSRSRSANGLDPDACSAGQVIEELAGNVSLAVDGFLNSVQLALPFSDEKLSRDTSSLYSVRVQLDRLSNHANSSLGLPQLRLSARRITMLLKNFVTCVSSPFPVPSCSFIASSLCDLLYRFEDLCSTNPSLVPSTSCTTLHNAINDFHYDVVKRLNAILLHRRRPATASTSGIGSSLQKSYSNMSLAQSIPGPSHKGSPAAMAPTIIFQRSPQTKPASQKGFLLSPNLEAARSRVRRSRSSAFRPELHPSNADISEITRRWKPLLTDNADTLIRTAGREGAESRAALKAACKLTRDVVDEIARRVEKL
uniref:Uncharacterized protein n=1 Tax=Panagrellus redivivus TaxID=6233 RepID=A0A7E4VTP8_PANRE